MKEKILLVEDNPDLIEIMRVFLTYRGYIVLLTQNGFEAVKTARSELPDLVITDILLPGMDGGKVALQLRKDPKTHHIPILALTAKSFGENGDKLMPNLFNDFLKKPANLHQLEAKIEKLLKEARGKHKPKENSF